MTVIYNHKMDDAAPSWTDMIRMQGMECKDEKSYIDTLRLNTYPSRALCLSDHQDVIQLNPCLRGEFDWIQNHYHDVGVRCTKNVVWDDSFEKTAELFASMHDATLSGFFFGHSIHRIIPNYKLFRVVELTASKNRFMWLCNSLQASIPITQCFDDKAEIKTITLSFPVFLKTDKSVGGLGIKECKTEKELMLAVSQLDHDVAFQLQEKKHEEHSVSFIYFAQDGKVSRVCASEQLVEDASHVGNVFPTAVTPWYAVEKIARTMARSGMEGFFGFDVLVDQDGIPYVIECNPRFTAATYPALLAHRLSAERWESRTFNTRSKSLSQVDLGDLVYTPQKREGVIVVSWGTILQQKLSLILVGSVEKCKNFSHKLTKVL